MSLDSMKPTACAEAVIEEILALTDCKDCATSDSGRCEACKRGRRRKMFGLIRQLIRDQYEHCAQIAECWVPEHDLHEELDGMTVGDEIAEVFRKLADERTRERGGIADASVLGTDAVIGVGVQLPPLALHS